jgi:hypothetical protein
MMLIHSNCFNGNVFFRKKDSSRVNERKGRMGGVRVITRSNFDEPVVLDENGIAGQIAVDDGRRARMQKTANQRITMLIDHYPSSFLANHFF